MATPGESRFEQYAAPELRQRRRIRPSISSPVPKTRNLSVDIPENLPEKQDIENSRSIGSLFGGWSVAGAIEVLNEFLEDGDEDAGYDPTQEVGDSATNTEAEELLDAAVLDSTLKRTISEQLSSPVPPSESAKGDLMESSAGSGFVPTNATHFHPGRTQQVYHVTSPQKMLCSTPVTEDKGDAINKELLGWSVGEPIYDHFLAKGGEPLQLNKTLRKGLYYMHVENISGTLTDYLGLTVKIRKWGGNSHNGEIERPYLPPSYTPWRKSTTLTELQRAAEEEMAALIGMDEPKAFLQNIRESYTVYKKGGHEKPGQNAMRLVVMGNPGCGKTTFCKKLAKFLHAYEVIERPHCMSVNIVELKAGYAGQTSSLVKDMFTNAAGGVLFLDEAYYLTPSTNDAAPVRDAIATLLTELESKNKNTCVVLAGYPDKMMHFLDTSNEGMGRRFPNRIRIHDYSPGELGEIAVSVAESRGYHLSLGLKSQISNQIAAKYMGDIPQKNASLANEIIELGVNGYNHRIATAWRGDADSILIPQDFKMYDVPRMSVECLDVDIPYNIIFAVPDMDDNGFEHQISMEIGFYVKEKRKWLAWRDLSFNLDSFAPSVRMEVCLLRIPEKIIEPSLFGKGVPYWTPYMLGDEDAPATWVENKCLPKHVLDWVTQTNCTPFVELEPGTSHQSSSLECDLAPVASSHILLLAPPPPQPSLSRKGKVSAQRKLSLEIAREADPPTPAEKYDPFVRAQTKRSPAYISSGTPSTSTTSLLTPRSRSRNSVYSLKKRLHNEATHFRAKAQRRLTQTSMALENSAKKEKELQKRHERLVRVASSSGLDTAVAIEVEPSKGKETDAKILAFQQEQAKLKEELAKTQAEKEKLRLEQETVMNEWKVRQQVMLAEQERFSKLEEEMKTMREEQQRAISLALESKARSKARVRLAVGVVATIGLVMFAAPLVVPGIASSVSSMLFTTTVSAATSLIVPIVAPFMMVAFATVLAWLYNPALVKKIAKKIWHYRKIIFPFIIVLYIAWCCFKLGMFEY